MQALRSQIPALLHKGLSHALSTYRSHATLPCCGSARLGSIQAQTGAASAALCVHCRRASSSSNTVPSSTADERKKHEDSSVAAESESAAATSGAASQESSIDEEASAAKRLLARDAIIQEILSRDKVVFELKRQHELSMLRVEQSQSRVLKDQEDRGMYYEQNSNVHTFDTISVGLYSQRSTLYHTMSAERLRNLKIFLMVFTTLVTCVYFYYRYIINPDWEYVERPMKMIGSRVQAVREQRWKMMSSEEKFEEMRNKATAQNSSNE